MIGLAVAIAMALTLLLLAIAQPIVLAYIVDPVIRAFAANILGPRPARPDHPDDLGGHRRPLIALGAWLAGPNSRAVAIRTGFGNWVGRSAE